MNDTINKPEHYTCHPSGIEPITITKHMNFCLGNVIKYVMRADYKGNRLEDLKKAQYYLNLEISGLNEPMEEIPEHTIENLTIASKPKEPFIFYSNELNEEYFKDKFEEQKEINGLCAYEELEEKVTKYNEIVMKHKENIDLERLKANKAYKAQYKPENWHYSKVEGQKFKDNSDPSGEPFLTDLCKVMNSFPYIEGGDRKPE